MVSLKGWIGAALPPILLTPALAGAADNDWTATVYAARISSQPGWEDLIIDAAGTEFVDAYLVAAALSRQYSERRGGDWVLEAEGQVVYNFGDQSHWEFNAVPVMARWKKF